MQIITSKFVFLHELVCKTTPQVRFNQHVDVFQVKSTVNHLGAVFDTLFVLLVLAVAESDIIVDVALDLANLFFKQWEILKSCVK